MLNGGVFSFVRFRQGSEFEKKRFSVHRLDTYRICNVSFPPLLSPSFMNPRILYRRSYLKTRRSKISKSTFNASTIGERVDERASAKPDGNKTIANIDRRACSVTKCEWIGMINILSCASGWCIRATQRRRWRNDRSSFPWWCSTFLFQRLVLKICGRGEIKELTGRCAGLSSFVVVVVGLREFNLRNGRSSLEFVWVPA